MSVVHSQQTSSPLSSVKTSCQCHVFGTALEMWLEKRQKNSSSLPGVIFLLSRNFPVKSSPFLSASHSFFPSTEPAFVSWSTALHGGALSRPACRTAYVGNNHCSSQKKKAFYFPSTLPLLPCRHVTQVKLALKPNPNKTHKIVLHSLPCRNAFSCTSFLSPKHPQEATHQRHKALPTLISPTPLQHSSQPVTIGKDVLEERREGPKSTQLAEFLCPAQVSSPKNLRKKTTQNRLKNLRSTLWLSQWSM